MSLVEETRELPEKDAGKLTAFAKWMAETYPQAIFRTGNADGADMAFANGVAQVDPTRIEYVLPYRTSEGRHGAHDKGLSEAWGAGGVSGAMDGLANELGRARCDQRDACAGFGCEDEHRLCRLSQQRENQMQG